MIDIADEFGAAAITATKTDYETLINLGVPRQFLYAGACRFGVIEIETSGIYYQPSAGARRAFIVPAVPLSWGEDDPAELVAWLPDEPGRWWLRSGMLPLLNPIAVEEARCRRLPLWCRSSPLHWLRGAGDGVVILDRNADLRLWLGGVTDIHADSGRLGDEIERRLRTPPARPRVLVPVAA
jgi:hypothetical protein